MKISMIYTLDYLEQEAENIAGHWNGKDEYFVDANGDKRSDEEAQAASELADELKKVRELVAELQI